MVGRGRGICDGYVLEWEPIKQAIVDGNQLPLTEPKSLIAQCFRF